MEVVLLFVSFIFLSQHGVTYCSLPLKGLIQQGQLYYTLVEGHSVEHKLSQLRKHHDARD